jgi:hypothetical protein
MSETMSGRRIALFCWKPSAALCTMLLVTPLVGCGGSEAPPTRSQAPATQPGPTGGGEPIEDHGAPGEAGGAPQDPAGQDAPSPKAPAPEMP